MTGIPKLAGIETPQRRGQQSHGPEPRIPEISTPQRTDERVKEIYTKVEGKCRRVGLGFLGVAAVGLLGGYAKFGSLFPSNALRVIGDLFGTAATVIAPYFMGGNELNNYSLLKEGKSNQEKEKDEGLKFFDQLRQGFYRIASLGFSPFIFEQFVNPKNWTKSIFHKGASLINTVNLGFTGYTWGYGNFKALTAWVMRTKKQSEYNKIKDIDNEKAFETKKEVDALNEIYESNKRLATIGSIANPTMQGLNQCADTLAFLTGKMPVKEFFETPFHGISRIVSLFVGIPETFAKTVDSINRVFVKERAHLKHALPESLYNLIEQSGEKLSANLKKKGTLHKIKDLAEKIFHTLSPLSMFALFTPLLGAKSTDDAIQAKGGIPALIDKVLGRIGKILTLGITGSYVTFGRLPQFFFQSIYFGRKWLGKRKGESAEQTQISLNTIKENLLNNPLITGISKVAKWTTEKLIPDFYNKEREIEHSFLDYEQIEAKYGFEQIQNFYAKDLERGNDITVGKINEIAAAGINVVKENAIDGNHTLSKSEEERISKLIKNKILDAVATTPSESPIQPRKTKLLFPGADLIGRFVIRGFDLKSRLESTSWKSDHHVKETAYTNDELWNFDAELLPVILECFTGFRNTINRGFKLVG